MRRFIIWIAAILITFAIGVGADRLWWHFFAAPPPAPKVESTALDVQPLRDIVYVSAPTPSPTPPKPNLILDYDNESFSVWAAFYIMGAKPREFADIDTIEAMLSPEVEEYPGHISLATYQGNEYDSAAASFGLVTEQRFFFVTEKLGDFQYRFDGEFLRRDLDAVAGKNKAVLRGTLTKMKNGRAVAHHEFTFRMEYMGC